MLAYVRSTRWLNVSIIIEEIVPKEIKVLVQTSVDYWRTKFMCQSLDFIRVEQLCMSSRNHPTYCIIYAYQVILFGTPSEIYTLLHFLYHTLTYKHTHQTISPTRHTHRTFNWYSIIYSSRILGRIHANGYARAGYLKRISSSIVRVAG